MNIDDRTRLNRILLPIIEGGCWWHRWSSFANKKGNYMILVRTPKLFTGAFFLALFPSICLDVFIFKILICAIVNTGRHHKNTHKSLIITVLCFLSFRRIYQLYCIPVRETWFEIKCVFNIVIMFYYLRKDSLQSIRTFWTLATS